MYQVKCGEQKVTFEAAGGRNLDSSATSCGASSQLFTPPFHWCDDCGCLGTGQSQALGVC